MDLSLYKTAINKTLEYVKDKLYNESTGHDYWHSYRVWRLSKYIAKQESKGDLLTVELSALLHDIYDWKFNEIQDFNRITQFLSSINIDKNRIDNILYIIKNISFKGANVKTSLDSIEAKIVQDADRLDALGAIGIARCFATGSKLNRLIYDPNIKPKLHKSFEDYKNSKSTSINHFYEKLLLIKDMMNTETAKRIAKSRHKFMEEYLKRFFEEWELK